MVRCGQRRTRDRAWFRLVLVAIGFLAAGLRVPAEAQELPPDSIYFPLASPVWSLATPEGSVWVRDKDTGNDDGIASPGERVELRIRIRNLGVGRSKGVAATLSITDADADVTVVTDTVSVGEFDAGTEVTLSFLIDIDAAATDHDVAAALTVQSTNPVTDGSVTDPPVLSITIPILSPLPVLTEVGTPFWTRDKTTGNNDGKI
ncbi:MAG: hypothetical protein ABGY41_07400, partial [Candidatus Poribacteria bacterium]